jgi:hypothetical protein
MNTARVSPSHRRPPRSGLGERHLLARVATEPAIELVAGARPRALDRADVGGPDRYASCLAVGADGVPATARSAAPRPIGAQPLEIAKHTAPASCAFADRHRKTSRRHPAPPLLDRRTRPAARHRSAPPAATPATARPRPPRETGLAPRSRSVDRGDWRVADRGDWVRRGQPAEARKARKREAFQRGAGTHRPGCRNEPDRPVEETATAPLP